MKRIFLVVLTCLFAQTAWAGWVVTYKDAETGAKSQEYYDSGKVKMNEMIYDGSHFYAVDEGSRAYWKGTAQQYCEGLGAQMKKMEAQMASLPAMYRPKPISQKKVTRKNLGNQTIAGFSATGSEFYVDGIQEGRIWLSSDSKLSGIIDIERSMVKKLKCLEGMEKMSLEGSALYKETTNNKFILKESNREVVSVKSKSVPSTVFEAPRGYKSFNDYQQFMKYASDNSGSSSGAAPSAFDMDSYERSEHREQDSRQSEGEESVVEKDAKEIGGGAIDEAHESTKRGIQEGISEDIQEGVGKLMDKWGF